MNLEPLDVVRGILNLCGILLLVLFLVWLSGDYSTSFDRGEMPAMTRIMDEMRYRKLEDLTAEYRAHNPGGLLLFVSGERIAPPRYLNRKLRRLDADWRVRIEGGEIRFEDVG